MTARVILPRLHEEECWKQDQPWRFTPLGSVRRCEHGRVQILADTPIGSKFAGPGTWWWRTLSPFWDRRLYRRAVAALLAAEEAK